jgi:hypothetical protein
MAEANNKVAIFNEYTNRGVVMVGVSLDTDRAALDRIVRERKMDWPMQYDPRGWGNPLVRTFGVTGIPQVFIIDPSGRVAWRGHAGLLRENLDRVIRETPPQLVEPRVLADAKAVLDDVERLLASKDIRGALRLATRFPEAAAVDGPTAERHATLSLRLEEAADQILKDATALADEQRYAEAVARLEEIRDGMRGTSLATRASEELATLMENPEIKAQIEANRASAAASAALDDAMRLHTAAATDPAAKPAAYKALKSVVTRFAKTAPGESAAKLVAEYEADAAFIRSVRDAEAADRARGLMGIADNYARNGMPDKAEAKYREIIAAFPGTSFAETARAKIAALK